MKRLCSHAATVGTLCLMLAIVGCGGGNSDAKPPSNSEGAPEDRQATRCLRNFNSVPNNRGLANSFSREPGVGQLPAWIGPSPAGTCMAIVADGRGNAIILEDPATEYPGAPPHAFFTPPGNELQSEAEIPGFASTPNAVVESDGSLRLNARYAEAEE